MSTPPFGPTTSMDASIPATESDLPAPPDQTYTPTGPANAKPILGVMDQVTHDKIVRDVVNQENFYFQQLTSPFTDIVRFRRLYLAKREDPRDPKTEKWRANVFVPYPYSGVETRVAALSDILNSSDPPIQAEGVGDEDYEPARRYERLLDYTLRKNHWRRKSMGILRDMSIDGTAMFKLRWAVQARLMGATPGMADITNFEKAVLDACAAGAPDPPDPVGDPAGFKVWSDLVNKSGKGQIPPPPLNNAPQMIERYCGPMIERVNILDTRFDPTIEDINDQYLFIHRIVKTKEWLMKRTGPEPDKPFDPAQVAKGASGGDLQRFQTYQNQILEALGITPGGDNDPLFADSVEIWECWRLHDDFPFCVILNQSQIINKHPDQVPFVHGENAITAMRNIIVPGHFLGISELQEPEALYYEMNALRNLRLDNATLTVLPVFMRLRDMGLPELKRKISPGSVIDVTRPDGIQQLFKAATPPEAFREIAEIKAEIDEANATYGNVRGQQATVNRISATETQSRLTQALTRMKISAISFEEEFDPAVKQMLALWYQYGDPAKRIKIGGEGDPMLTLDRAELLEALDWDYRFRGATRAINRELTVQQLIEFGAKFAQSFTPVEIRSLMKMVYETMGLRNINRIVSDQGTQYFTEAFQRLQQQQGMADQQAQDGAQAANTAAPTEVSAEVAQAVGAQGQPPAPGAPAPGAAQAAGGQPEFPPGGPQPGPPKR